MARQIQLVVTVTVPDSISVDNDALEGVIRHAINDSEDVQMVLQRSLYTTDVAYETDYEV